MASAQPEPTTTTTEAPTTTTSETTTTTTETTTTAEPTTESTETPGTTTSTTVAPASSDDDDSFISSGAGIALIVAAIVAVLIALIALAVGASRRAVRQRAGSVDPRAAAMLGDLQSQTRQVAIEAERSEQAHAAATGAPVEYAEATLRQAVQSLQTALAHARSWLGTIPR
jgi:uncharacterized protein HemX